MIHLDIDLVSSADSFPILSCNNNVQFKFNILEYCLFALREYLHMHDLNNSLWEK